MEREMKHFSHVHPLVMKAEKHHVDSTNSGKIKCDGCMFPICDPFYGCKECPYYLHKVCAELPHQVNLSLHTEHPLTLHARPLYRSGFHKLCDVCYKKCNGFFYHCSQCDFDVDMECASASYRIKNKYHPHPLVPVLRPSSFFCNICRNGGDEGSSYKCTTCPFWVHQICTLKPTTVVSSNHQHPLSLIDSMPLEYRNYSKECDICLMLMLRFECGYHCGRCMFFVHVPCSTLSSRSDVGLDQRPALLPVRPESLGLIVKFVGISKETLKAELDHFGHSHPLIPLKEDVDGKICDACILPISNPSYGCSECGYFLHQICANLPNKFLHPLHPEHEVELFARFPSTTEVFICSSCKQPCNGFGYKCAQCDTFYLDIKCASLVGPITHEAHRHDLAPTIIQSDTCSACRGPYSGYSLKCDECNFNLSMRCAMLSSTMKHRFGMNNPFNLTYSPKEDHSKEYICELCEHPHLNPKIWHYHSVTDDQFVHVPCLNKSAADWNIKYGKQYKFSKHTHELTLVPFTNDFTNCNECHERLNFTYCTGYECKTCEYKVHATCPSKENI